jgi:hypothetical protein
MATAWKVAAAIAVIGWLVAPVIAYFLPKVMSYLVIDPSEKLRDLKTRILPDLEKTLHEVDQARMMRKADGAREQASDSSALSDMAAWLRHAREDAEDIFDDALEIDLYRNSCWELLYGAVATCKSSFVRLLQWAVTVNYGEYCSRLYGAVQSSMWIALQWPANILHRFGKPVSSGAASHAHAVDIADSDSEAVPPSHEEAVSESAEFREQVSEATPSELVSVLEAMIPDSDSDSEEVSEATPSESASEVQDSCSSISDWLLGTYKKACSLRDWSYDGAGITSYQVRRQFHHPTPYAHACPI